MQYFCVSLPSNLDDRVFIFRAENPVCAPRHAQNAHTLAFASVCLTHFVHDIVISIAGR